VEKETALMKSFKVGNSFVKVDNQSRKMGDIIIKEGKKFKK